MLFFVIEILDNVKFFIIDGCLVVWVESKGEGDFCVSGNVGDGYWVGRVDCVSGGG